MVCAKCGSEEPEGADFCKACGEGTRKGRSRCPSCGREVDRGIVSCPYCGLDFRAHPTGTVSHGPSLLFKAVTYAFSLLLPMIGIIIGTAFVLGRNPGLRRVGVVCLVLAIVNLLGLSAFYLFFDGDRPGTLRPTTTLEKSPIEGGWEFVINPVLPVEWSDVTFVVGDGFETVSWQPLSEDLDGGSSVTQVYVVQRLSGLAIALSITDLAGNGCVDGWDRFTVTSSPDFSTSKDYFVWVVYEPSDDPITMTTF